MYTNIIGGLVQNKRTAIYASAALVHPTNKRAEAIGNEGDVGRFYHTHVLGIMMLVCVEIEERSEIGLVQSTTSLTTVLTAKKSDDWLCIVLDAVDEILNHLAVYSTALMPSCQTMKCSIAR